VNASRAEGKNIEERGKLHVCEEKMWAYEVFICIYTNHMLLTNYNYMPHNMIKICELSHKIFQ
jgi:hypothetical protein